MLSFPPRTLDIRALASLLRPPLTLDAKPLAALLSPPLKKYDIVSSFKASCKWKEKDLIEAVKESYSYAEALRRIGLDPKGSNYGTIKSYVNKLELDVSHFNSFKRGNSGYMVKSPFFALPG